MASPSWPWLARSPGRTSPNSMLDWGAIKRAGELAQLFRAATTACSSASPRSSSARACASSARTRSRRGWSRRRGRSADRGASAEDEADIAFGARLIAALSDFDAGQCAVVAGRRVLAIEAAEGTDAMLARVAEMRRAAGSAQRPGRRARQDAEARAGPAARHAGDRPRHGRGRSAGAACAGWRSPPAPSSSPSASGACARPTRLACSSPASPA